MEYSYDNIVSYHTLGRSHQVPIGYINYKYKWYTNMATPFGRTSTITPADNHQSPNNIPSDEDSLCTEPPLPIVTYIKTVTTPPTKDSNTEPSD